MPVCIINDTFYFIIEFCFNHQKNGRNWQIRRAKKKTLTAGNAAEIKKRYATDKDQEERRNDRVNQDWIGRKRTFISH